MLGELVLLAFFFHFLTLTVFLFHLFAEFLLQFGVTVSVFAVTVLVIIIAFSGGRLSHAVL